MEKLVKKIIITKSLQVLTGLHVGGSTENVEIGGIDRPVIKIAVRNNQPYIPGSSLKGKIRCLLEQARGATNVGDNKEVNNLFGFASDNLPSKLIVRDAYLTEKSVKELSSCNTLDMPYTEGKWENSINRVEGKAANPRQIERVPAGAVFTVEFVINVWDDEKEAKKLLQLLEEGMNLLESDYLGGNGSRGYGQVKFGELQMVELCAENNWKA